MPLSPVPVSQFPNATTPLSGTELVPIVQNGQTKKVASSQLGAGAGPAFGAEGVFVALAGNNDNISLSPDIRRVLVDTTAGDATITGLDATGVTSGTPILVTNQGPNLLTLAAQNAGSLAANRIYSNTDITKFAGDTFLMVRSGTLSRWVLVT